MSTAVLPDRCTEGWDRYYTRPRAFPRRRLRQVDGLGDRWLTLVRTSNGPRRRPFAAADYQERSGAVGWTVGGNDGRLLLRASLRAAGVRNDISEDVIQSTFAGWTVHTMDGRKIPSDTRQLEVLAVRLERPVTSAG